MLSPTGMTGAQFAQRVNARENLVRRGRHLNTRFLLEVGNTAFLVSIAAGRVTEVSRGPFVMPNWTFALRAPEEAWAQYWKPVPAPGYHDLFALLKRRLLRIEGDLHPFMANLFYFKELTAAFGREAVL